MCWLTLLGLQTNWTYGRALECNSFVCRGLRHFPLLPMCLLHAAVSHWVGGLRSRGPSPAHSSPSSCCSDAVAVKSGLHASVCPRTGPALRQAQWWDPLAVGQAASGPTAVAESSSQAAVPTHLPGVWLCRPAVGRLDIKAAQTAEVCCVIQCVVCALLLARFCCLVTQSCPTLCDPMDCGTPGFPVHHQFPELAQTHVR